MGDASRTSKRAIQRKQEDGSFISGQSAYDSSSQQASKDQRAAKVASKLALINHSSIPFPADLQQALVGASSTLTPVDREEAERWVYAARPGMKLELLRLIFIKGTDPHHSFDCKYWQTRVTYFYYRWAADPPYRAEFAQAYLDAVDETKRTPPTFTARENFVRMWERDATILPKWNEGARKWYAKFSKWLLEACKYHSANAQTTAQQVMLALGEPVTLQSEVDELVAQLGGVAQKVYDEFSEADLAKKMEIVQIVGGGKGVGEAFGLDDEGEGGKQ